MKKLLLLILFATIGTPNICFAVVGGNDQTTNNICPDLSQSQCASYVDCSWNGSQCVNIACDATDSTTCNQTAGCGWNQTNNRCGKCATEYYNDGTKGGCVQCTNASENPSQSIWGGTPTPTNFQNIKYTTSGDMVNNCGFTAECSNGYFYKETSTSSGIILINPIRSCVAIDDDAIKPNITKITYNGETYTATCNDTFTCPSNSTPNSNQTACIANKGYYYTGQAMAGQNGCVTSLILNATKKCPTGTTTSGTGATTVSACNVYSTGYCCTVSTCRTGESDDCYEAQYTIVLDKNGGTDGTAYFTFKYNTADGPYNTTGGTSITPPTKNGHDFDGFYIGNTQYIGSNGQLTTTTRDNLRRYIENNSTLKNPTTKSPAITLTAKWTPRKYYVGYNTGDSTAQGPMVNYGATFTLPTTSSNTGLPAPAGQIFTHWTCYTDANTNYECNSKCTGKITQEMINNGDCEPTSGANGAMLVLKANWADCTNGTVSSDATTCTCNTGYTPESWTNTNPSTCTPKIYTIYVFKPDNTNTDLYAYKYNTGMGKRSSSNTNYTTTISPKPTKTKHNFDGYITTNASASENGTKVIDENGSLIIDTFNEWVADYNTTTPLYIKPTFTPKTYTVIYDNVSTCDDTATYDTEYIIRSSKPNNSTCTLFTYPGTTQSGKEFVGWKSDEHGDTIFVAGEVLTELDTEYSNANVQLSPAYAACSAGHFCTSDKKEPCPNGSTSDAGANKKQQCYLSLSNTGTRIKDKTKTINLNELMTDSDNKIYYK